MPLSIRDMAAALGVTKSQIGRDKQAGMPMDTPEAARAWREANRDPSRTVDGRIDRPGPAQPEVQAAPSGPDDADDTPQPGDTAEYRRYRTERERIRRDREQLSLETERGQVVDALEAARLAATTFRALRDQALNVGARLKAQLATETDEHRIEALIDAELTAVFAQFDEARLLSETEADDEAD